MLSKKMAKALNDQINAELYSSYLYLSMAAWCEAINLKGFGNWMRVQAKEEDFHAMKFFDYMLSRQGKVALKAIDGPPTAWKSPRDVFEAVYAHEEKVTALINGLVKVAREENDNATSILLQWYVTEQVEEEANADAVIQKLKLIGDNPAGLFMLDQELAARVFVPPVAGAAAP